MDRLFERGFAREQGWWAVRATRLTFQPSRGFMHGGFWTFLFALCAGGAGWGFRDGGREAFLARAPPLRRVFYRYMKGRGGLARPPQATQAQGRRPAVLATIGLDPEREACRKPSPSPH